MEPFVPWVWATPVPVLLVDVVPALALTLANSASPRREDWRENSGRGWPK